MDTVLTIVKSEGRGDVLCFLPGMEVRDCVFAYMPPSVRRGMPRAGTHFTSVAPGAQEIDQGVAKTKEYLSAMGRENTVLVLPLYASLPHHLQMKAIGGAPRHVERKVIFATNIAETSLTIDGAC